MTNKAYIKENPKTVGFFKSLWLRLCGYKRSYIQDKDNYVKPYYYEYYNSNELRLKIEAIFTNRMVQVISGRYTDDIARIKKPDDAHHGMLCYIKDRDFRIVWPWEVTPLTEVWTKNGVTHM